jgi:hypothetical protein
MDGLAGRLEEIALTAGVTKGIQVMRPAVLPHGRY